MGSFNCVYLPLQLCDIVQRFILPLFILVPSDVSQAEKKPIPFWIQSFVAKKFLGSSLKR